MMESLAASLPRSLTERTTYPDGTTSVCMRASTLEFAIALAHPYWPHDRLSDVKAYHAIYGAPIEV